MAHHTTGDCVWRSIPLSLSLRAYREVRRTPVCAARRTALNDTLSDARSGSSLISILLAVVLAFTFAASPVALARELHHDCAGEGCAVCAEMAIGMHLSRDGISPASAPAIFAAAVPLLMFVALDAVRRRTRLTTLVFLKVQLND